MTRDGACRVGGDGRVVTPTTIPTSLAAMGEPLARGASADIFLLGHDVVLKLFRSGYPRDRVVSESRKVAAAVQAGVPTAAAGDVIEIGGRLALVMERVNGVTLTSLAVSGELEPVEAGRVLAELHAAVHADAGVSAACTLPSLVEHLTAVIERTETLGGIRGSVRDENRPAPGRGRSAEERRAALLALLADLGDGDVLCHGDVHPDNVLVPLMAVDDEDAAGRPRTAGQAATGAPRLIDWADAARGPALADVAQTVLLLTAVEIPAHIPGRAAIEELKHVLNAAYLERYFALRPGSVEEVERWLPIRAASRLALGNPAETEALLAVIDRA